MNSRLRMTLLMLAIAVWFLASSAIFAAARQAGQEKANVFDVADAGPEIEVNKTAKDEPDYDTTLNKHLLLRLLSDQREIWLSPTRLRAADAEWLLPGSLLLAGTLATDSEFTKHLPNTPGTLRRSNSFSTDALVGMAGAAAGMYVFGRVVHDEHKAETGFLAGEAAMNSLGVVSALKYTLQRERPLMNNYQGSFGKNGDGFPSEHAAAAWSIASVIAHEYPGALTQILAYGMASAVSATRLTAKQHFASDVLVGSAIGWLSGEIVYRNHHDPELGGATWQTFKETRDFLEDERPRQNMGTAFVELDSSIYPALERLSGLGYIHSALAGQRPWTRMECARLVEEASESLQEGDWLSGDASAAIQRLQSEFGYELGLLEGGRNASATLESVYLRALSISGAALTDGYHFGQTEAYDFGRPFERGLNGQAGGAFRAALGPLVVYIRAEYQHRPGAPAPSPAVRNIIAVRDLLPEPGAIAVRAVNRPQFLDAYVGVNLGNWQLLAGQQSLEWGPGAGGSLLWSDNAQPVEMVRFVNSEPVYFPGFLKHLGPTRFDSFFGELRGHPFTPHPYIYGQKFDCKPLRNLELGFGHVVTIGGKGADPLTFGNFLDSLIGRTSGSTLNQSIPGDSHFNLEWTFYVPKVRNFLVLYGEFYADDFNALSSNPRKNPYPYRPGIYLTRFPGIAKLDFHAEVANTQAPSQLRGAPIQGNYNYWNFIYRDGYTNAGNLLGNAVGRMGVSYEGWLTYWWSARNTLQLIYKNSAVNQAFIPGGGAWQDYGIQSEVHWHSGMYLKNRVQYEHIAKFPILFASPRNNITAELELGFARQETRD